MENTINEIAEKLKNTKGKNELKALHSQVEGLLEKEVFEKQLLHLRAEINIKLQQPAKAINDYNLILGLDPKDSTAKFQVEHLKTILKFNNTDIYANPNTNLDPWLE